MNHCSVPWPNKHQSIQTSHFDLLLLLFFLIQELLPRPHSSCSLLTSGMGNGMGNNISLIFYNMSVLFTLFSIITVLHFSFTLTIVIRQGGSTESKRRYYRLGRNEKMEMNKWHHEILILYIIFLNNKNNNNILCLTRN